MVSKVVLLEKEKFSQSPEKLVFALDLSHLIQFPKQSKYLTIPGALLGMLALLRIPSAQSKHL